MDWPTFVIQWLHVLLGIFWFGASLTANLILVPALSPLPLAEQQRFGGAYGTVANRVLPPVAYAVVILGVIRGTVFGPLQSVDAVLGSAYGLTWLAALVVALGTQAFAQRVLAPNIGRLSELDPATAVDEEGRPSAELSAIIGRAKRHTIVELAGFGVIFTCMILMRFGV
jgi:uncharacterized membrane protein